MIALWWALGCATPAPTPTVVAYAQRFPTRLVLRIQAAPPNDEAYPMPPEGGTLDGFSVRDSEGRTLTPVSTGSGYEGLDVVFPPLATKTLHISGHYTWPDGPFVGTRLPIPTEVTVFDHVE